MKVLSYKYGHEDLSNPTVEIETGFWFRKKVHTYICLRVGLFTADWVCKDTGKKVSIHCALYNLLNDTGRKAQLEANIPT